MTFIKKRKTMEWIKYKFHIELNDKKYREIAKVSH